MEIRTVSFEKKLVIIYGNQEIYITPFLTIEPGNIKLGIDAPKTVRVNREEVHLRHKTE